MARYKTASELVGMFAPSPQSHEEKDKATVIVPGGGTDGGSQGQPAETFQGPDGLWYEYDEFGDPQVVPQWMQEYMSGMPPEDLQPPSLAARLGGALGGFGGYRDTPPVDRNAGARAQYAQEFWNPSAGGGGGNALGYAQLAESKKNNAFERALAYLTSIQNEQQAASGRENSYAEAILRAAPSISTGRDYYGGFGPYGGGTLMELMQGGIGGGIPMQSQNVALPSRAPADLGIIERLLGGLV